MLLATSARCNNAVGLFGLSVFVIVNSNTAASSICGIGGFAMLHRTANRTAQFCLPDFRAQWYIASFGKIRIADLPKERMRVHTLVRIDTRTIADDQSEIRAFIPVRNEVLRLPQTLGYYRKLGVARFFVVDNGSTDGSKEFLLAQPDCYVFVTHN